MDDPIQADDVMEILLRVCEEAETLYRQIEEEDGMTLEKTFVFNEALILGFRTILNAMRLNKEEMQEGELPIGPTGTFPEPPDPWGEFKIMQIITYGEDGRGTTIYEAEKDVSEELKGGKR